MEAAEQYAQRAVSLEKYNAKAIVNLGNTFFARGDYDRAAALYAEALAAEADCTEALFNQGLALKRVCAKPTEVAV
jgi:intraflagellar transport protein 88